MDVNSFLQEVLGVIVSELLENDRQEVGIMLNQIFSKQTFFYESNGLVDLPEREMTEILALMNAPKTNSKRSRATSDGDWREFVALDLELEAEQEDGTWLPCRIVETSPTLTEVKVHYDGKSDAFDQWFSTDALELRARGTDDGDDGGDSAADAAAPATDDASSSPVPREPTPVEKRWRSGLQIGSLLDVLHKTVR